MILTRTPFRISFVGGGSDLPSFYRHHPGAVLSTSINKYMYISSHKFFEEDKIRLKYSKVETVMGTSNIRHPIFKETLTQFDVNGGIEFASIADVPAGTGMGSSSSFAVGLLHNLYVIRGELVTKEQLAQKACEIEIQKLGEPIGKQDQYAAAYGGLNMIHFFPDDSVKVEKIQLREDFLDELQKNLILYYIGAQRKASEILEEQKQNIEEDQKKNILIEMTHLVNELKATLVENNMDQFGTLLDRNWKLKKRLAGKITNTKIDDAYALAIKNGALGGKLLGAGGGGFLLFYCQAKRQEALSNALGLRQFDFKFEHEGSKVIRIID